MEMVCKICVQTAEQGDIANATAIWVAGSEKLCTLAALPFLPGSHRPLETPE